MRVITLTTDFGLNDWFVGSMKGVILAQCPRATVVDITHGIAPGDIRGGAFALLQGAGNFPRGTVHVAVVDPGVGGDRAALVIETDQGVFLGPDNGVLSFAVRDQRIRSVRCVANTRLFRQPVSRTFHGRDIFAPVAAHLARGLPIDRVGPRLSEFVRLTWPEPERQCDAIHGQILYIDRFGNAMTNVDESSLATLLHGRQRAEVWLGRRRVGPETICYSAVGDGRPLALIGSTGLLEIAVNGGSAAHRFALGIGDRVVVRRLHASPPRTRR